MLFVLKTCGTHLLPGIILGPTIAALLPNAMVSSEMRYWGKAAQCTSDDHAGLAFWSMCQSPHTCQDSFTHPKQKQGPQYCASNYTRQARIVALQSGLGALSWASLIQTSIAGE